MTRRPTQIESGVIGSWLLLFVASAVMGFSSKVWDQLLWAILGSAELPDITVVYLSSIYWFALIPAFSGVVIWRLWDTGKLDRSAALLMLINQGMTVAIAIFTSYATIRPLIHVTWDIK